MISAEWLIVAFLAGFFLTLMLIKEKRHHQSYIQGRGDGWMACERMIHQRIDKEFPDPEVRIALREKLVM